MTLLSVRKTSVRQNAWFLEVSRNLQSLENCPRHPPDTRRQDHRPRRKRLRTDSHSPSPPPRILDNPSQVRTLLDPPGHLETKPRSERAGQVSQPTWYRRWFLFDFWLLTVRL